MPLPNVPGAAAVEWAVPIHGLSITHSALKIVLAGAKAKFGVLVHHGSERAVATRGIRRQLPRTPGRQRFFIKSRKRAGEFHYVVAVASAFRRGLSGSSLGRLASTLQRPDELGLKGIPGSGRSQDQTISNTRGGMKTSDQRWRHRPRSLPTASASLTWVKNNHTFKVARNV